MSDGTKAGLAVAAICAAYVAGIICGQEWKKTTPPSVEAPAIVEPVDAEAWIDRRLAIVNERCGPVPYHVAMTKEWIDIDCGRPANLGKVRVPRPESTAAVKVAEVKGVEVKP